ncbi:MAG: hypothetical protein CM1200mP10_31930 [Candidatus Neomarinimicrobiota bacterium]|nr:MAG: hypothetical protein CM1200mP10_31930 [Candidatus Neomarinimicrobiota bacterium]
MNLLLQLWTGIENKVAKDSYAALASPVDGIVHMSIRIKLLKV